MSPIFETAVLVATSQGSQCEPTKSIYISHARIALRGLLEALLVSRLEVPMTELIRGCVTKECVMQRKGFTPDSYQDPTAQTSKYAPFLFEPRFQCGSFRFGNCASGDTIFQRVLTFRCIGSLGWGGVGMRVCLC